MTDLPPTRTPEDWIDNLDLTKPSDVVLFVVRHNPLSSDPKESGTDAHWEQIRATIKHADASVNAIDAIQKARGLTKVTPFSVSVAAVYQMSRFDKITDILTAASLDASDPVGTVGTMATAWDQTRQLLNNTGMGLTVSQKLERIAKLHGFEGQP